MWLSLIVCSLLVNSVIGKVGKSNSTSGKVHPRNMPRESVNVGGTQVKGTSCAQRLCLGCSRRTVHRRSPVQGCLSAPFVTTEWLRRGKMAFPVQGVRSYMMHRKTPEYLQAPMMDFACITFVAKVSKGTDVVRGCVINMRVGELMCDDMEDYEKNENHGREIMCSLCQGNDCNTAPMTTAPSLGLVALMALAAYFKP
ncbi:hypothetical protein JYU34_001651 [Plutella xylostella]|uniref:Protein sleepless n=1 Tax=Plutella xylostella TaxID=51655 RepID=A0ABQ7R4I5_PLUXY|nr:uncharacterized protein LOC105384471 [Plutella xylostella]KAG7312183.1 hypothetical protein JYU34_001651 [Plutella xylostella]